MNCTMRAGTASLRRASAVANSCASSRGTRATGTTKPVIDSINASTRTRCRLVSPPAGAIAAATPPAMIRVSAASGGCRRTSASEGNGTGIAARKLLLDELDQSPERRLRVHERDRRAAAPGPGLLRR